MESRFTLLGLLAAASVVLAGCAANPAEAPMEPPSRPSAPPSGVAEGAPAAEAWAPARGAASPQSHGGVSGGLFPDFQSEEYGVIHESGFVGVASTPLSTFSIDVDTASYANVRRLLHDGMLPPSDAVRIEELINYFEYDYPDPDPGEPVSIVTEMAQVKGYRLVGYENRRLRDEAFNDDEADAGDMGAGHSVTALYEIIPAGSEEPVPGIDPLKYQHTTPRPDAGSNEVLTVKLRYKSPEQRNSRLLARTLTKPAIDVAGPSEAFRFSAAMAEFGLLLRDFVHKGDAAYDRAVEVLGDDEDGRRSELLSLIRTARNLTTARGVTS